MRKFFKLTLIIASLIIYAGCDPLTLPIPPDCIWETGKYIAFDKINLSTTDYSKLKSSGTSDSEISGSDFFPINFNPSLFQYDGFKYFFSKKDLDSLSIDITIKAEGCAGTLSKSKTYVTASTDIDKQGFQNQNYVSSIGIDRHSAIIVVVSGPWKNSEGKIGTVTWVKNFASKPFGYHFEGWTDTNGTFKEIKTAKSTITRKVYISDNYQLL